VAIASSRRLMAEPVDVGVVRRGGWPAPEAGTVALGRGDGATLLLRFALDLSPDANVLEAYVLLHRVTSIDVDPVAISLHAARITAPWQGLSVSWASQPELAEIGAPISHVPPEGGPLVRIDVHEIVQRWLRRRPGDLGVAILAEGGSASGITFAVRPSAMALESAGRGSWAGAQGEGDGSASFRGPVLELYVK
jgi:hypothetical protein